LNQYEFDLLWDKVIVPQAKIITNKYGDIVFADYLKDSIYMEICELINHCKKHYMKNSDKFVDRHKVAACVMIGLLKYTPMKIAGASYYTPNANSWCFNENLSITAGLSILVSFIKESLKSEVGQNKISIDEYNNLSQKIENGIKFPTTKHGDYRTNWTSELYHTRKDGAYNLLALAHELFFLEHTTLNN